MRIQALRILASAALFWAASAAPAFASPVVRVLPESAVPGPTITLGEIAEIEGGSEAERALLRGVSLGAAAEPAQARRLPRTVVEDGVRRLLPDALIVAPEELRVHTAYREIDAGGMRSLLERAIRHRMPWPASAVGMSQWRVPERVAVPVPATRTLVHFRPGERFLGRVHAEIAFVDPQAPVGGSLRRRVTVDLDVRMPVVVAARRLRRSDVLNAELLRMEERDLRLVAPDAATSFEAVLGRQLRRGVAAGVPIVRSQFVTETLVRRGDLLLVYADAPGLELKMEARALEAGGIGEVIRAENPASRRRFQIQVTGPGTGQLPLMPVGSRR